MSLGDQSLVLDGLATGAGSFALGPIDLTLPRDRVLAVLGPSGAGKSTLLETIAGFRRPTAGHIVLGNQEVTALPPEKRNIGFVFQDAALFPHLSVRDNVRFALRMRRDRHDDLVDDLLGRFDIGRLAERSPRTLSEANASAWPWRVRSPLSLRSCSWTNRCLRSTSPPERTCAPSFRNC